MQGPFVAAFASTNLGDVSPNIKGPRCQLSGVECDMYTSKCPDNKEFCVASGPGADIFESTKMIAENLYTKAMVRTYVYFPHSFHKFSANPAST